MSIYWPLSFIRIAPYYILGWNGPKERKSALNDVKPLHFSAFLLESRMLQRTQASNRPLWLFSNQWKNWPSPASMSFSSTSHDSSVPRSIFSRVRVARAFPGILTFSLSQPSQKSTTTYLVPLPRVTHTWCDLRKAKTAFFDTKLTILLKIVRKTRVILCNTTHYRQIGEGCESKNINFAVRTRARRSQIRGD